MKKYFQNNFALDFRSLAIFRICLGCLILVDVLFRLNNFTAHYTEGGITPTTLLLDSSQERYLNWSLFFLNDSATWAVVLFAALIYSIICFIIGYKTKTHSVALWVLVLSMQARCPYICFGADSVIRVLLFWSLFLPIANRWAIDSRKVKYLASAHYSLSTLAFTLQIVMIYWFNAVAKGHPMWRVDYSAVEHVLNLNSFSTSFGVWLVQFPEFLKIVTRCTLWLEELGPLLLFIPYFRNHLRTVVVMLFICFHIGLALAMHLGIFPYVCMIAWIPFLPSTFWRKWGKIKHKGTSVEICNNKWKASFCGLICLYIFLWNARTLTREKSSWFLPSEYNIIADITRVGQEWHLFAPRSRTNDFWLIVEVDRNGVIHCERLSGKDGGFSLDETRNLRAFYSGSRERGFVSNLFKDKNPLRINYFAEFIANKQGVEKGAIKLYVVEHEHAFPEEGIKCWQIWPNEAKEGQGILDFRVVPLFH